MKKSYRIALLSAVLSVAAAGIARADAGTPLIWATFFQLWLGNLFFGIGEGYLLVWRYGTSEARSIWVMILANYVSAWVGLLALNAARPRWLDWLLYDPTREHALATQLAVIGVLYVFTILLEWPFCHWVMRTARKTTPRSAWTSLRASVLVQTASYAVLLPFYLVLR